MFAFTTKVCEVIEIDFPLIKFINSNSYFSERTRNGTENLLIIDGSGEEELYISISGIQSVPEAGGGAAKYSLEWRGSDFKERKTRISLQMFLVVQIQLQEIYFIIIIEMSLS